MKIGLFDIDSKYHNLALMKLSTSWKKQGYEVEFYNPLFNNTYDLVFVSKIFRKPHRNDMYVPIGAIRGGTGYVKNEYLPEEDEHLMPDYSLYNLNYSLGFTTRGCIRNCGFCMVRWKEGYIKEHAEVEEFLNSKSNIVVLLDNNFLALPSHIKKLNHYIDKGWKMDFNQGLDIRLVNEENAKLLAKVKHYKQIHFAWDQMKDERKVKEGLDTLFKAGIKPYRIMVYILCNYNTTFQEDMYRYKELNNLGVDPFVMIYGKGNKEIKNFARWVNKKWISGACSWEDYNKDYRKEDLQKWIKNLLKSQIKLLRRQNNN